MRSVTWESFLASPAGRTVLAWEEGACARFLANKSGNRALQIGFGALNPFAASPITHRILIDDVVHAHASESDFRDRVLAQADALPLCDECCDAIVLAHTFDRHPEKLQATVNEAARVLAPNGLLIALFFNAMGSWALREKVFPSRKILPNGSACIPILSIKAAIQKAGLSLEGGNFGVYAVSPDKNSANVRLPGWLDKAGDRWWPTLSNVILLSARKVTVKTTLVGKVNFATAKSGKTVSATLKNSESLKTSNDAADCS